jgi:hypothetical protein
MSRRSLLRVLLLCLVAALVVATPAATRKPLAHADAPADPTPLYDRYTPTTEVFDNGDGTLTAIIHAGPVQAPDAASETGWSPIDVTLQATPDGLVPELTDAAIQFSSGSEAAPMATVEQDGTSLSVGWDGEVPAPTVEGDTATYPALLPGVDATLQAKPQGFEVSFVVASPQDAPAHLQIPLAVDGLDASLTEEGALVLTGADGEQVGGAEPARMWGAAVDPDTGEPAIQALVPTTLTDGPDGMVLELSPDPAFFTDPALTYPVVIDPAVDLTMLSDAYVDSSHPTTGYGLSSQLRAGLFGTATYRSFIAFDRNALIGQYIDSATLTLHQVGAYSCTASQVDLYSLQSTGQIPVTWNNQPAAGDVYATATAAHGASGSCPAADVAFEGGGTDGATLADLVQLWAEGTVVPAGVELKADSETDPNGAKVFDSSEAGSTGPVLSVTYSASGWDTSWDSANLDQFIVECDQNHALEDDPIMLPGSPGDSHWHNFFANPRTDADSTRQDLEAATVPIAGASMTGGLATFVLGAAEPPVLQGGLVTVLGVDTGSGHTTDYDGVWTVQQTGQQSTGDRYFTATLSGVSGLGAGTGGSAGERDLSCGSDGQLTYDTAAYWAPAVYDLDGQAHIPVRQREYYLGVPSGTVTDLPDGLALIGGNGRAGDPGENPHLFWTCGRDGTHVTPALDHPYDCTDFGTLPGWDFVDGPVGIVDMPRCYKGSDPGIWTSTVYPEDDGTDDKICEAPYGQTLPLLSLRTHIGRDPFMDPCGGCVGRVVSVLQILSCTGGVCDAKVTVSSDGPARGVALHDRVNFNPDAPYGWPLPPDSPGYEVTALDVDQKVFTISGVSDEVSGCGAPRSCGGVFEVVDPGVMDFTLAGGSIPNAGPIDTTHPFYDLHADFWNTWQQDKLAILEEHCIRLGECQGNANIARNSDVDGLDG